MNPGSDQLVAQSDASDPPARHDQAWRQVHDKGQTVCRDADSSGKQFANLQEDRPRNDHGCLESAQRSARDTSDARWSSVQASSRSVRDVNGSGLRARPVWLASIHPPASSTGAAVAQFDRGPAFLRREMWLLYQGAGRTRTTCDVAPTRRLAEAAR